MRLSIVAVGKLKAGPEGELFRYYWKMLETAGRSCGVTRVEINELAPSRAASALERRRNEGQRLLSTLPDSAVIIALDERGHQCDSEGFARQFAGWLGSGRGAIVFMIGGADGHEPEVLGRADKSLSLSAMTLPHMLARIVLAEQIYRAITIINRHPYHRSG